MSRDNVKRSSDGSRTCERGRKRMVLYQTILFILGVCLDMSLDAELTCCAETWVSFDTKSLEALE